MSIVCGDRTVYTLQNVIYNHNELKFALSSHILGQNMSADVIFLNLVLIFLYFYLFGWTSFINYLEGGVIIKRNSAFVRTEDIKQPGNQDRLWHRTIFPILLLIFQES